MSNLSIMKCGECPDSKDIAGKLYCNTLVMKYTSSIPSFLPEICGDRVYKNNLCKHGYKIIKPKGN